MMQEAKLSLAQQRELKERMIAGADLPKRRASTAKTTHSTNNFFDMKKNYHFIKRSKHQIVNSGAYEPDHYWNPQRPVDRARATEELQNLMTFGKCQKIKQPIDDSKPNHIPLTKDVRLRELKEEISERLQFLEEMSKLNEGKRYKTQIMQEIEGKLREIKDIERMTEETFNALVIKTSHSTRF